MEAERRLRLTGHLLRMSNDRNAKRIQNWTPLNGKRNEVDHEKNRV